MDGGRREELVAIELEYFHVSLSVPGRLISYCNEYQNDEKPENGHTEDALKRGHLKERLTAEG